MDSVVITGAAAGLATSSLVMVARWLIQLASTGRGANTAASAEARGVNIQMGGQPSAEARRECSDSVRRRLDSMDERDRQRLVNDGRLVEVLQGLRESVEGNTSLLREIHLRMKLQKGGE